MSWHYRAWIDLLRNPARLPPIILTLAIIVLGWFSLFYRKRQVAVIFIITFLTVLLASALRKYPFGDRLMMFSLPLLFFLLAEGIERSRLFLLRFSRISAVLSCAFLVGLFWSHPLYTAYSNVIHPKRGEDIKPVMAYLKDNRRETDSIYVYYGAQPAFQYYASGYGFAEKDYIVGIKSREDPAKYLQDVHRSPDQNSRWFVFSHNCTSNCMVDEKNFILYYLDTIGIRKDEFVSSEASMYRYDLKRNGSAAGRGADD